MRYNFWKSCNNVLGAGLEGWRCSNSTLYSHLKTARF